VFLSCFLRILRPFLRNVAGLSTSPASRHLISSCERNPLQFGENLKCPVTSKVVKFLANLTLFVPSEKPSWADLVEEGEEGTG